MALASHSMDCCLLDMQHLLCFQFNQIVLSTYCRREAIIHLMVNLAYSSCVPTPVNMEGLDVSAELICLSLRQKIHTKGFLSEWSTVSFVGLHTSPVPADI